MRSDTQYDNSKLTKLYNRILLSKIDNNECLYYHYSYLLLHINRRYNRAILRYYPNVKYFHGVFISCLGDIEPLNMDNINSGISQLVYIPNNIDKNNSTYLYFNAYPYGYVKKRKISESYNIAIYLKNNNCTKINMDKRQMNIYVRSNNIINILHNYINDKMIAMCIYEC